MRSEDIKQVRALPLFAGMATANFDELLGAALLQRFPAGVTLIHEGTLPEFLHVIVDGLVEIYSDGGAGQAGIALIRPVTTIILAAVVRDQVHLNSARTANPSRILLIPAEKVRQQIDSDPVFARAIVDELALAYRGAIKKLKGQMVRSSTERLANWILSELRGPSASLTVPFDRATLAAHIGTTRENLSRSLAHLTEHGLRVRGRELVVDDRGLLARFAQPQPLIDDPAL
ncbi:MAG: helix-turn-helix domain-containing protein [Variibacter sp.]|nr:helix-turn-helix domain-containing protein [Variibacter sp.]